MGLFLCKDTKVSGFQGFRVSAFQRFRVSEFDGLRVSGFYCYVKFGITGNPGWNVNIIIQ